jgi:CBS domain-containing protein
MRVRDIMSKPVYTVRATDSIEAAAALLADRNITAAPVVDEAGRLIGMVSEGDLLVHRVPADPTAHLLPARGEAPAHRPRVVDEVMTHQVVTAWPLEDVADVAATMLHRNVRSIPVLDGVRVIGIVSRRDILRTVVRTDDVLRHEVQDRLDGYAGGTHRWTVTVVDGAATVDGAFDDEVEQRAVTVLARTVGGIGEVRLAQPTR